MNDVLQLEWSSYVGSDAICLVLRNANFPRRSVLHTHDFAEVFMVETGRAIHQTGPREHQVTAGDVVFVRPDDIHRFRSPTEDFVLFNVAFPASVLSDLRHRYAPHMPFPWDGDAIRAIRPNSLQSTRLREIAVDLGHQPSSHVRLDRYLIEVLASAEGPIGGEDLMPPWLRESIERWKQDSNAMGYGVRGLAELAGRSREHVSRVIRQTTNMRAVDLVNRLRMETAAGMLRLTETAIPRIAAEVGLPNLSHFYEVFRAQYGTTPRAYRVGPRKAIDPPPIPGARPRSPATPAHRPRFTADQEHERGQLRPVGAGFCTVRRVRQSWWPWPASLSSRSPPTNRRRESLLAGGTQQWSTCHGRTSIRRRRASRWTSATVVLRPASSPTAA